MYFNACVEGERNCVVVGATFNGDKELLAITDGALGFWKALSQVFPSTRMQRCWVHKTANVLDKLPKPVQPRAKTLLHDIYLAETEEAAVQAFNHSCDSYRDKYPKAVECLERERLTEDEPHRDEQAPDRRGSGPKERHPARGPRLSRRTDAAHLAQTNVADQALRALFVADQGAMGRDELRCRTCS